MVGGWTGIGIGCSKRGGMGVIGVMGNKKRGVDPGPDLLYIYIYNSWGMDFMYRHVPRTFLETASSSIPFLYKNIQSQPLDQKPFNATTGASRHGPSSPAREQVGGERGRRAEREALGCCIVRVREEVGHGGVVGRKGCEERVGQGDISGYGRIRVGSSREEVFIR